MARVAGLIAGMTVVALMTMVWGVSGWTIGAGLVVLAVACWFAAQCTHGGRLGLLPPMADADGRMQPARWYCPQCEAEWPASFENDRHPVQKFSGYDEGKAIASAQRASHLEMQQRRLAVARAGLYAERASGRDVSLLDNVLTLPRNHGGVRKALAKSAS